MPVQTDRRSVAAGAVVENILAGTKWEFPSRPTAVRIFARAASTTGNGTAQYDLTVANVVVGENLDPNDSDPIAGPVRPDDLLVEGAAMPGQRIQIRIRETGGSNAVNVRTLIEFVEA